MLSQQSMSCAAPNSSMAQLRTNLGAREKLSFAIACE
jgi:hypothetical protein